MIETLASIANNAKDRQYAATFGHLAPKPNTKYNGYIIFTHTAWGDTMLIEADFSALEMSPWLCSDCRDFAGDYIDSLGKEIVYGVFKFKGSYRKFKNGNFRFTGNTEKLL